MNRYIVPCPLSIGKTSKNMMDGNKNPFLVETALLGQGIPSIENEEILSLWPDYGKVAWIEKGKVRIGPIQDFLPARKQGKDWHRFDGWAVQRQEYQGQNGFLTASGTMEIARNIGCPVVVTAGIGGIGNIRSEPFSYDLPALSQMEVTLVATSPKDMLDIPATLEWLHGHGVRTLGFRRSDCNGYLFILDGVPLNGRIDSQDLANIPKGANLILNPISEEKRLQDLSILEEGIGCGRDAENNHSYFHPAVNKYFDEFSGGRSSRIQLKALIENIHIAAEIK